MRRMAMGIGAEIFCVLVVLALTAFSSGLFWAVGQAFGAGGDPPKKSITVIVDAGTSEENNVGCGYGLIDEKQTTLELILASNKFKIKSSSLVSCNPENIWRQALDANGAPIQTIWRCERLGSDPAGNDNRVDPNERHWCIIKVKVEPNQPGGAGGGGTTKPATRPAEDANRWVSVSDIDVDADSDNDSTDLHRPPSETKLEDANEFMTGGVDPAGLLLGLNDDIDQGPAMRDNKRPCPVNTTDDDLLKIVRKVNAKKKGKASVCVIDSIRIISLDGNDMTNKQVVIQKTGDDPNRAEYLIGDAGRLESGDIGVFISAAFTPDAPTGPLNGTNSLDVLRVLPIRCDIDADGDNSGTTAAAIDSSNFDARGEDFFENHAVSDINDANAQYRNGMIVPVNDDNDGGDPNADNGWQPSAGNWNGPDANTIQGPQDEAQMRPLVVRALRLNANQISAIEKLVPTADDVKIIVSKVGGSGGVRVFWGTGTSARPFLRPGVDANALLPSGTSMWQTVRATGEASFLVEGLATGEVKLQVKMELWHSPTKKVLIHKDIVRLTVFDLDLKETDANNTDGNAIAMRKQGPTWTDDMLNWGGDTFLTRPVWKDHNYDDKPEANEPVCVLINQTLRLKNAVLKVPSLPADLSAKIKVEATASTGSGVPDTTLGPVAVVIPASSTEVTVPTLTAGGSVGTKINNFRYDFVWKYSVDGGTNWTRFQDSNQTVFVLLAEPASKYYRYDNGNFDAADRDLARTAMRIDHTTKLLRGKTAANVNAAAGSIVKTNYLFGWMNMHPSRIVGLPAVMTGDPWFHMDFYKARRAAGLDANADCISQAGMASVILRMNKVDAAPARAFARYDPCATDSSTWGWHAKGHPVAADWHLGYKGNNFEGFYYIDVGLRNTPRVYPSEGYTVSPENAYSIAAVAQRKYMPLYVIDDQDALTWVGGADKPDVCWKDNLPANAMAGADPNATPVDPNANDAQDGAYNLVWSHDANTMALRKGGTTYAAVPVTASGSVTLTCPAAKIKLTIDFPSLPAANDGTHVLWIAPSRSKPTQPYP